MTRTGASIALIALALAPTANAEPWSRRAAPPRAGRHHVLFHELLLGAGATAYLLGDSLLRPPPPCTWCRIPTFDVAARDALRWSDTARADRLSDLTGIVLPSLVPVGALFFAGWHDASFSDGLDDVLAVGEAAIATGLVTQVVKASAARERPDASDSASFFSGHTSYAFSIAVASGTVASAHHHEIAPVLWTVGLTLAATTGYLRVAADRHYLSDVVVGAAAGSALGFAVPSLLHDHAPLGARVVPIPGGLAVAGTF